MDSVKLCQIMLRLVPKLDFCPGPHVFFRGVLQAALKAAQEMGLREVRPPKPPRSKFPEAGDSERQQWIVVDSTNISDDF